jgi:hypothetical protein
MHSHAQQSSKSLEANNSRAQSIYGEIGGNGLIITANYDFRFKPQQNGLGMRIGFGYFPNKYAKYLSIPVGITELIGKAPQFFELGLGYTYSKYTSLFNSQNNGTSILIPSVGFRYQPVNKGVIFRIVLSPLFPITPDGGYLGYGGLSFGYKF